MSENENEEEFEDYENLSEKQKEGLRKVRKTVQVPNQTDLTITAIVDDKEKERLLIENEDLKSKLDIVAQAKFKEKIAEFRRKGYDKPINNIDDLRKAEAELRADWTSRPSSGVLTLESQGNSGKGLEFENEAEMIDFLIREREAGATAERREEAQKILNELWRKTLVGRRESKVKNEPIPKFEDKGEGLIKKAQKENRKRKGIE